MTTVFPGAIDTFSTKVDGVTDVLAAHVNDLQDSVIAIETAVIAQSPNANLLYHTLSHDIWPDGVTFNDVTDDTYVAGLWNALHNGQNPDVSGEALIIAGSKRAIKCLFDSASSQAGFVQFLTSEDTLPLRGKTLSFSIDAVGFNVSNMRCAILEWTGTADVLTSDVVATWGAGNPTLATNWAYIGTPADQALSGTTRIKAEGKVVGATTNNLAVFIWNPALEASTDYFRLANAKLEIGLTSTAFVVQNFSQELANVQHFVFVPDASNNTVDVALGAKSGTAELVTRLEFPVPMRTAPTFSHNVTAYTAGTPGTTTIACVNYNAGAFYTITGALTVAIFGANKLSTAFQLTAGTSWNGTIGDLATLRLGPSVVMIFDARL